MIAYYLRYRDELDAYLARREAEGDRVQRMVEAVYGPQLAEIRERLNRRRTR